MASPIPYLIQQGDTLSSVALKLGIKDEYYLKKYHNNNCELKNQTGGTLKSGEILLTPPPDEIKEMNRKATISQEEDEEAKKEEECKEEEEEEKKDAKKEEEAKKGEHEGKYFVVHGATCICDKAEDTSKTAKLKVTSHEKVVFNDEDGKYVATSDDTTLDPPAATFGKCTLKPSSSGNQPCTFSPAGKWQKFYEKTKIADKPLLTEISILQCTIGGKVTIKKHGQTNSVTKEHAENSTPVELAMINPAVKMPLQQPSYPEVSYITLKSIENRPDFKERSSNEEKTVEKILVRPNEMCRFEAKLGKGNKDLTSWLVYDGNSGDKENRLMVKEQQGIVLEEAFGTVGNYRIEGYGKPKQGVHDKNYASCSLDIVVQHNVLDGGVLKCIDGESFTKTIDGAVRLRKGFSAEFKANFLVPPTPDELNRLEFFVYDAAGAALNYIGGENILYFVPENSNAKYKVLAEYTDTAGRVSQQIFEGKTLKSNSVANISHPAQLVRYGEDVDFSVEKMTISFLVKDDSDLIKQEINTIKWSLDNVQIGTGRAIKIPTAKLPMGDHVVEAFCVISNAFGANAKEEDDDWHFKVVKNDVQIVGCHTQPKVGKKTKLLVKKFLFPNLLPNEKVFWDTISIENKVIGTQSIEICPSKVGLHTVKCRINNLPGKELKINVKQAKIKGMLFTDSNGIEIQKASWGQTIYIWLEQEYLTGEKVKVEVWDDDKPRSFNTSYFDDRVKTIDIPEYDGGLIKVVLDKEVKDETGDFGLLYIKVFAPLLQLKNEGKTYPLKDRLHVIKNKEIYKAHFGDEDGAQKHTVVDYDKISWFYANSRGFSKSEKLTLEVRKSTKINFTSITIPQEDTLLLTKEVEVDDSGTIKQQLKWSEIKEPRAAMLKAYGVIKDAWGAIKYNGGDVHHVADTIVITKTSQLVKIVGNKSAVMVGSAATSKGNSKENKNIACECEARVRAFMRMLRVGEGTGEIIVSKNRAGEIIYIPHDFEKGYTTAFGGNHIANLDDHPRIKYGGSSAAGAYQVMPDTWDDAMFAKNKKLYKIDSFSKENQDKFSVLLMKHHPGCSDLLKLLLNGQTENSIRGKGSRIWASLPEKGDTSRYLYRGKPQPVTPMKTVLEHFEKYLKEELAEKSPLHLKKGFLNKFNIQCNCGNGSEGNSDWHDPIENPEITLYNYYGAYNPAGSSFGKVRDGGTKNHQGLDIFAPSGTPVTASLDGTIVIAEYDGNWGNLIVIEVTKEDLDNAKRDYTIQYTGEIEKGVNYSSSNQRFLRYAHLSEMSVTVNQKVTAGQVIGKSGKTGNAENQNVRARHLHFGIANIKNAGKGTGERENPAFYVRLLSSNDDKQKNNTE